MMNLDHIVSNLVQKVERRFFGKYRGFVVDTQDPEKMGRLKVSVPSVLGDEVVTGWAMPCLPYGGAADQGWFAIPDAGAGVWVEFEEGDLEFPIWVGTFWSAPGGASEVPTPNDVEGAAETEVQDPPTRKILKTAKGHTLQFEDADDAEEVLIVFVGSNGSHLIRMDANGIELVDATGNTISMKTDAFAITAEVPLTISAPGNTITIIADTIDLNRG